MNLRNKLDKESTKSKFENRSRSLDEILSVQIPSSDKCGLRFDKGKPEYSSYTNQDGSKRIYAIVLMIQIKREEIKKSTSLLQRTDMMHKRPVTSKHQQLFLANCYTCNNFGHMYRNCKLKTPVEKGIT